MSYKTLSIMATMSLLLGASSTESTLGPHPITFETDDGKADFDKFQAAVDAASDGDEFIVMPGLAIRLHEKGWTGEHLAKLFGGNLTRVFLGEKITKE